MLEGAYNFRDLGGLLTRGGRRLRTGRVFRSDTVQALTAADVRVLHGELGVRGIVDLRLTQEVAEEGRGPLATAAQVRYANLPLPMAATEGIAPEEVMRHLYLSCLAPGSALPGAVRQVCLFSDGPILFHCAAGKDRTGLLAAVLLRLMDVDDEQIVADYMLSAAAMPRMIKRFATWPRYRAHMANTPPQAYGVEQGPLRDFLKALDAEPDGAFGWLVREGVPANRIEEFRSSWVE